VNSVSEFYNFSSKTRIGDALTAVLVVFSVFDGNLVALLLLERSTVAAMDEANVVDLGVENNSPFCRGESLTINFFSLLMIF
jgi:hypothetical protein